MIGTIRLGLRLLALVVTLLALLPLHGMWRIAGRRSPWPRRFLAAAAWIVGVRRRMIGKPLRRDVVFVANHLSAIDTPLVAGATGAAFVARDDLARVPILGWLCRLNATIFVARGDRMGVAAQVATIRAAIEGGQAIALFPEGTTGDGVTLLPFKPALLAVLDGAPAAWRVQPIRIDYGEATGEMVWGRDEPGLAHALRVLRRRGSFTATLRFGAPFVPEGGRKAIAAEAQARIAAAT